MHPMYISPQHCAGYDRFLKPHRKPHMEQMHSHILKLGIVVMYPFWAEPLLSVCSLEDH